MARQGNRTFRSLRNRGYRWFAAGSLLTNIAVWMQRIAQDWLVIQETGSPLAVGVTTALQFLPVLLFGPFFGSFADRWPKRRMIAIAGVGMSVAALLMGLVIVTGTVADWHIYALAFILGTGAAADGPVRQAYIRELVPKEDLSNAISLGAASFHSARIIGPAIAGVTIAWIGTGPVFLLVGLGTLLGLLTLIGIGRPVLASPSPDEPPLPLDEEEAVDEAALEAGRAGANGLRGAWRHLRARPALLVTMALAGLVCAFALNFQVTVTLMATTVYGLGADEFGALTTIMAIGSIAGALLSARRQMPGFGLVVGTAIILGVLYGFAGYAPNFWVFGLAMLPIGLVSNTFMTSANAAVQLRVEPQFQGRVMALYIAASNGLTPLGAPLIGWIAQLADARLSLAVGGFVAVAAALAALAVYIRIGAIGRAGPHPATP
jgi:MFS family permease